MESISPAALAALLGLAVGAVVGATALLSNFCALGAVADLLFARDWRRMRAWMLAASVALFGTQGLDSAGVIHLDRVLLPYVLWLPTMLGGLCFGFGMALAGGCVNRALVRLGAGSLKSLVTILVVGVVAAATSSGVVAPLNGLLARNGRLDVLIAPEGLHRLFAVGPTFDSEFVRWSITAIIGGGLVIYCLKDAWFRGSRDQLAAGVIIGAMIPAAWVAGEGTGALNFAAPTGDLLLATVAGRSASVFGMASVVGVPLGAFVAGLITRNLALETFTDRADLPRNLVGAAMMGFGGSIALGCTFGQGLSGFSTLSVTALIAIAAMLFGCLWGIRYFEAGGVWQGLQLTFRRGV